MQQQAKDLADKANSGQLKPPRTISCGTEWEGLMRWDSSDWLADAETRFNNWCTHATRALSECCCRLQANWCVQCHPPPAAADLIAST
jgi:hypothetical protein